jgi:hypothetical protein
MSYELAKELKGVGFPQLGDGFALIPLRELPESDPTMSRIPWCQYVFHPEENAVYEPTLSELIEACGRNLDLDIRENRSRAFKIIGAMELAKGDGPNPRRSSHKIVAKTG